MIDLLQQLMQPVGLVPPSGRAHEGSAKSMKAGNAKTIATASVSPIEDVAASRGGGPPANPSSAKDRLQLQNNETLVCKENQTEPEPLKPQRNGTGACEAKHIRLQDVLAL